MEKLNVPDVIMNNGADINMNLKLNKKQRLHVLACLQYCEGQLINYGNIRMEKFSYKMNSNLIDKLNKENRGNGFVH